jgi:hypothetical protein
MIVKYGSTCDSPIQCHEHGSDCGQKCGRRSPEFRRWPVCRVCGRDTCRTHVVADSLDSEQGSCCCKTCGEA